MGPCFHNKGPFILLAIVSTLLVLLHLGLLQLFFGGTEVDSVTKEWTGLIGQNFRHLTTHTWIVVIHPAICGMYDSHLEIRRM